jgi:hypothetical protein
VAATYDARTISVSIDRDPRDVYAFASHPANLPQWASGLSGLGTAIEQVGDAWVTQTPDGPVTIRFAPSNPFGVLDHWVRPATGDEVYAPMRVIPNGAGSQMLFTLFRLPRMSDEQFAADAAWVERDLFALKALLEAS